jgi:hypothetical protein
MSKCSDSDSVSRGGGLLGRELEAAYVAVYQEEYGI